MGLTPLKEATAPPSRGSAIVLVAPRLWEFRKHLACKGVLARGRQEGKRAGVLGPVLMSPKKPEMGAGGL